MGINHKIAGVVLAGGRSSRMGRDKAFLTYKGKPLIDHMIDILTQAGCDDIFISGSVTGYFCIEDKDPHQGPALAMCNVLRVLKDYAGVFFVPVDMPLLTSELLVHLREHHPRGGYYINHPLPAFIQGPHSEQTLNNLAPKSVFHLLEILNVWLVALPEFYETQLLNINDPVTWRACLHMVETSLRSENFERRLVFTKKHL